MFVGNSNCAIFVSFLRFGTIVNSIKSNPYQCIIIKIVELLLLLILLLLFRYRMIGCSDSTKLVHPISLLDLKSYEKESSVSLSDSSLFPCRCSILQKTPSLMRMTILCMLWQLPRLLSNIVIIHHDW